MEKSQCTQQRLCGSLTGSIKGLFGHEFEMRTSSGSCIFFSRHLQMHKYKVSVVGVQLHLDCGFAE